MTDEEIRAEAERKFKGIKMRGRVSIDSFIDGAKWHREQSDAKLKELNYWKERCRLAENCLEESPCDPDITIGQINAHSAYHEFIRLNQIINTETK